MFGPFLDWFERHKVGVVGALMLHTFMIFTMAMFKLKGENQAAPPPEMALELEAPPEPKLTPEQLQQQLAGQDVQNRVSDMNASPERTLSHSTQERISEQVAQDLKALEQAEFERLAEERTAEGRDIVVPKLDPSKFDPKNYMEKKATPVKVEGNVTVKVDVPGRFSIERTIEVPAYLCKGHGQVQILVSVDASGAITKADVDPSGTNTTDDCLVSHALESANGARFERASVGRSSGTITYLFVAQ